MSAEGGSFETRRWETIQANVAGRARVIDGDTLEVRSAPISLLGIDTPESAQICREGNRLWPCGERATRTLAERIDGRSVACEERDQDRCGRIVAVCHHDGQDVTVWMVHQGFAMVYRRYSTAYVDQEAAANRERLVDAERGDDGWSVSPAGQPRLSQSCTALARLCEGRDQTGRFGRASEAAAHRRSHLPDPCSVTVVPARIMTAEAGSLPRVNKGQEPECAALELDIVHHAVVARVLPVLSERGGAPEHLGCEPLEGLISQCHEEFGRRLAQLLGDLLPSDRVCTLDREGGPVDGGEAQPLDERRVAPADGIRLVFVHAAVRDEVTEPRVLACEAERLEEVLVDGPAGGAIEPVAGGPQAAGFRGYING